MWKEIAEFPIWKGLGGGLWLFVCLFVFSHIKNEKKGWSGSALFSTTLCTRFCWMAVPPFLWGQNCAGGLAPLQTASCCLAAPFSGRQAGCFSFVLSSSWPPNWKYLGSWQQRLPCFFHMNHETGGVRSASGWRVSVGLSMWWGSSLGRLLEGSGNRWIKRCVSTWRDTGVPVSWHPVITTSLIPVSLKRTARLTHSLLNGIGQ